MIENETVITAKTSGGMNFLIPGEEVLISTKNVVATATKSLEEVKEETSEVKDYALWGNLENKLPQELQMDVEFSPLISGIVRLKSEMQYSGGLSYGFKQVIEKGAGAEEHFKPIIDAEIESFLRKNNIHRFLMACLMDMNTYSMAFPQLVLDQSDKPKVKKLMNHTTRAKNCRVSKADKYGNHSKVFVNPNFGISGFNEDDTMEITALPEFDKESFMRGSAKRQFVDIIKIPDLGRVNHTHPDWDSTRNSAWLEIAELIAQFKKYLIQNQASIKYHIEIDEQYWPARFGTEEWRAMSQTDKETKMRDEIDEWAEFMKGPEKSGNLQVTTMKWDESRGVHRSFWKITELKGFVSKDGVYIEDSREASENIMVAFGMHPDIIGNAPGTNLGSGSGSGNRVSYNQRLSMAKFTQDSICAILDLIADFNGWRERLEKEAENSVFQFRFRNSLITTLDTGAAATAPQEN